VVRCPPGALAAFGRPGGVSGRSARPRGRQAQRGALAPQRDHAAHPSQALHHRHFFQRHVVQAQAAETESAAVRDESDLLRVIADQSRGQFTAIFSTASFTAALDRLADRLAIEMMVQYLAPAGPRVGDVRVGVRKPGARVIGLGVK